jgi:hypothetical protein
MFLNKVSFDAFKQKFSEKVQTIGSFCGRKVEVLKSSATPFLAKIQSAANTGLNTLSQAAQTVPSNDSTLALNSLLDSCTDSSAFAQQLACYRRPQRHCQYLKHSEEAASTCFGLA